MKTTLITKSTAPSSLSGFTLAELMVTVAILGILLAVAIPIFGTSIDGQRIKDCAANKKMIVSAINRTAAITGKNLADIDSSSPSIKTILNRYLAVEGLDALSCKVGGVSTGYTVENGAVAGHMH